MKPHLKHLDSTSTPETVNSDRLTCKQHPLPLTGICACCLTGNELAIEVAEFQLLRETGVSENRGTLLWGPYNKDPTI